jgi:alkaline phosphatase D
MPNRRDALKAAAALPLAALPAKAAVRPIVAGPPIAGHFTHDSVRLWLQATLPSDAKLRYWPIDAGEGQARELAVSLAKESGNCAIVDVKGLAPGAGYLYRVTLAEGATRMGRFRTAPPPGTPPGDFRVYMGSCAYTEVYTRSGNPYGANHQIFDTMAARMAADPLPHFMLWMGDNLYLRGASKSFDEPAEYSTAAHMELRYKRVRAKLMLRNLFAATHHYAIWDDHDYGPNNSDKTFELKEESLRLFRAYWPNPPMGTAAQPGTFFSFRHHDAEFFMLDSRWSRDPEGAPVTPGKAQFGRAQLEWLQASLAASKARFKVVAGGSQFFSEGAGSGWHRFPYERDAFLAWLGKRKPPGLVFLSGDRHHTVVFRREFEGWAVHEFTCSPLTSKVAGLAKADLANPALVKECAVENQNYGTLEFSGEGADRKLTARCFDADGAQLWARVIA